MDGTIGFSGTLSGSINNSGSGTENYNELSNKPSINSVPLIGNKTSSDLHIFEGDYDDLTDKPSINGVELNGSLTSNDLHLFSGDYNDLTNRPAVFQGDYDDLTDKPAINGYTLSGDKSSSDLGIFSGDYNELINTPTLFSGDYDDLSDKPSINNVTLSGNKSTADLGLFSGSYNDLTDTPTLFSGDYDDLSDKPSINGVQLTGNKNTTQLGLFSGSYNDLSDVPDLDFAPADPATLTTDKIKYGDDIYEITDTTARGDISQINARLVNYVSYNITWNISPSSYQNGAYYYHTYVSDISRTDYDIVSIYVENSKWKMPLFALEEDNDGTSTYKIRLEYAKSDFPNVSDLAGNDRQSIIIGYIPKV